MKLDVSGHPLHTRVLTVDLASHEGGKLSARGTLLDIRKCGFLPLTGYLQPSGIIHHMQLNMVVDQATRILESIEAQQPVVAYESSPLTQMENCRDTIHVIENLSGTSLDSQYAKRLRSHIGGASGCTHLFTLAQLLGSSVIWALDWDSAKEKGPWEWPPNERIFQRTLTTDGYECRDGALKMAIQLVDLHLKPTPATACPMDHFESQLEVRVLAEIDMNTMSIYRATAAERRRNTEDIAGARWEDLSESLKDLSGLGLMSGVSGFLLRRFGRRPSDRPLLDALLNLVPGFIQCIGSMGENHPVIAQQNQSLLGMGKDAPVADSCYMWRKGGALIQIREKE